MIDWAGKHLVPEAREWWKLWSARLLGLALFIDALTLSPVLAMMPANVRAIHPETFDVLQMVLVAAALAARFVRQSKLEKTRAPAE